MTAACGGITTERNARISSTKLQRDHDEDLERQLARDTRGEIVVARRSLPPTSARMFVPFDRPAG